MGKLLPGLAVAVMHPLYYLALQIAIQSTGVSTLASYTARIATLALLGVLFFFSLSTKDGKLKAKWSYLHVALVFFMLFYLARMYILQEDGLWRLDPFNYPYTKVFPLFILGVIIPCLLCLYCTTLFNTRLTSSVFIFATFVSIIGLALFNLDQFGTYRTKGYESGSISSLSMGYMAALGVGYCLLDMLRLRRFPIVLNLIVLVCCVFLFSISASRGPLLAVGATIIYMLFVGMEKSVKSLLTLAVLVVTVGFAGFLYIEYSGSGLFDRIDSATEAAEQGNEADARILLYEDTIERIGQNWLFGVDIATTNGHWPHNYILEATLAVGIFSILLLVPWVFALGKIAFVASGDNVQWLYVWFLQNSVMNMFTEAIWSGSSLFVCLFLVIGVNGQGNSQMSKKYSKSRRRKRRTSRKKRTRPLSEEAYY